MSKRGLSLFVSAIMLTMFALTGCGGGTKATEETKAVEATEATKEEAKSEESKEAGKTIVVGYAQVVLSLIGEQQIQSHLKLHLFLRMDMS